MGNQHAGRAMTLTESLIEVGEVKVRDIERTAVESQSVGVRKFLKVERTNRSLYRPKGGNSAYCIRRGARQGKRGPTVDAMQTR